MDYKEKIEAAEARIKELELMVRHWKAAHASSDHVALELVTGLVSDDYEVEAA